MGDRWRTGGQVGGTSGELTGLYQSTGWVSLLPSLQVAAVVARSTRRSSREQRCRGRSRGEEETRGHRRSSSELWVGELSLLK